MQYSLSYYFVLASTCDEDICLHFMHLIHYLSMYIAVVKYYQTNLLRQIPVVALVCHG